MVLDSGTVVGGCRTKGHGWPDCGSPPLRPLPGQGGSKKRMDGRTEEKGLVRIEEPTVGSPQLLTLHRFEWKTVYKPISCPSSRRRLLVTRSRKVIGLIDEPPAVLEWSEGVWFSGLTGNVVSGVRDASGGEAAV